MHYSKIKKEDGYYEVLASFEEQTPSLFRLRAVVQSDNTIQAVVRHAHSGVSVKFGGFHIIQSGEEGAYSHAAAASAIKECKEIVSKYIKEHI
jgi:hypothetical protein